MKLILKNLLGQFGSIDILNSNFSDIEQELQDKVLYRNNPDGEPNQMETDLDMNSKNIMNIQDLNVQELILKGTNYEQTLIELRDQTEDFKEETNLFRNETETFRDESSTLKTQTSNLKDDTSAIRDDVEATISDFNSGYTGFDDNNGYDFGSVVTDVTYFDRDWGSIV